MADAERDQNRVPTLLAVSSDDESIPIKLVADPATGRLLVNDSGGGGGSGTEYTEDAAAPATPTAPALQVRRRDTLAGETTADGDWVTANGTDKGEVYVKHVDAIPVTDNGGSLTVDAASLPLPTGAATAARQDTGNTSLATLAGAVSGSEVQVDVLTMPTTTVQATNLDVRDLNSGSDSVAAVQSGSWAVQATGDVAHDGADSGNPVKVGGQARTTNPTAAADADRTNFIADKLGKQVVVGSIRDLKTQQQTTITSSTSETTVLTAVASTFLDVYGVIVANTSATAVDVTFKDATAGTTRFNIYVPAGDTRGFMLPESAAHNQASVNNNWTATCSASVASVKITMFAVKNI